MNSVSRISGMLLVPSWSDEVRQDGYCLIVFVDIVEGDLC